MASWNAAPPQMAFFECGGAIYFQVSDIRAVCSTLRQKGVAFKADPRVVNRTPKSELWLAEFTDPDGNQLALMSEVAAAG